MDTKLTNLTPKKIAELSYTDFVGIINQWNVPPGALSTVNKWALYSRLNSVSYLLEMACTTGFSSRELAKSSGCSGIGIDISQASIAAAIATKKKYASGTNIEYQVADAYAFKPTSPPSHIVLGAALKFFPDPQRLIDTAIGLMGDEGYILASPFYIKEPIPEDTVRQFQGVFGITPTTEGYKDVMKFYRGLEIIYQDHMEIYQETDEEIRHYCESTVSRQMKVDACKNGAVFDACFKRLYEIKKMSNLLRPHQKYTTLVLRYTKGLYPHRYIELF